MGEKLQNFTLIFDPSRPWVALFGNSNLSKIENLLGTPTIGLLSRPLNAENQEPWNCLRNGQKKILESSINNSSTHGPILLKFGKLIHCVHCEYDWTGERTTGRMTSSGNAALIANIIIVIITCFVANSCSNYEHGPTTRIVIYLPKTAAQRVDVWERCVLVNVGRVLIYLSAMNRTADVEFRSLAYKNACINGRSVQGERELFPTRQTTK